MSFKYEYHMSLLDAKAEAQRQANQRGVQTAVLRDRTSPLNAEQYPRLGDALIVCSLDLVDQQPPDYVLETTCLPDLKKLPFGKWVQLDSFVMDPTDRAGVDVFHKWVKDWKRDKTVSVRTKNTKVKFGGADIPVMVAIVRRKPWIQGGK